MRYIRLATWILVAALGLVAGCQSNSCNTCSGGLMSRFGMRRSSSQPIYEGGVIGTPVSSAPLIGGEYYGGDDYGGPILDDPTFMGTPTTVVPGAIPNMTPIPNMSPVPSTTLPPPLSGDRLQPVPGTTPGQAQPFPASPSSRSRW